MLTFRGHRIYSSIGLDETSMMVPTRHFHCVSLMVAMLTANLLFAVLKEHYPIHTTAVVHVVCISGIDGKEKAMDYENRAMTDQLSSKVSRLKSVSENT